MYGAEVFLNSKLLLNSKHTRYTFFFREFVKVLSGHVPEIQAEVEVVKIKNPDFSCWAWSTPWGHVLSLKSFCWNPVLSWAIRYSVFQPVKFSSSFEFVCRTIFSTFWHLVVKFGYNNWFLSNKKVAFFRFGELSVK